MPAVSLTMRKTKEIFRLNFDGQVSNHKIAESYLVVESTVGILRLGDTIIS